MPPVTQEPDSRNGPLHDPRLERTYVGIFEELLHAAEAESRREVWHEPTLEETFQDKAMLPGSDVFKDPASTELVVGHEIGRGGMGIVLAARQPCLARDVAVKTIHPELARGPALARFEAEASVLGRLEHPCIVPVYAFGRDDKGRSFLAMRDVKGLAWSSLIRPETDAERARSSRLGLRGHVEVLLRVVEAVAFAHDKGIVHRDLKPANVIVGDFGEVQVVDWGLAVDVSRRRAGGPGAGAPSAETRAPGAAAAPRGTPSYMAPEMLTGDEALIDERTDVFQLGGLLYEALAGAPPFTGATAEEIREAARRCAPEPPSKRAPEREASPGLELIALRALSRDPAARPPSAEAFGAAIEEYLQQEASTRLSTGALVRLLAAERDARAGAQAPSRVYAAFAEASADLERALELWPGNRSAAQGLARAPLATAVYALEKGDLGAAEAQLDRVQPGDAPVAGLPTQAELRARLALLRESRARERLRARLLALVLVLAAVVAVAAAVQLGLFRRRAERAVASSEARQRALAAVEGATWKEARDQASLFRAALAIDPTWHEGWVNLATAHLVLAEDLSERDAPAAASAVAEALSALDACLAMAPDDEAALLGRARCLLLLGRETAARDDLARAARGAEGEESSHASRAAAATLALLLGRAADAEAMTGRAIELSRDPEDFTRRAVARYVQGKVALGVADIRVARSLAPTRRSLDGLLALFEAALGDERAASRTLVRAARSNPARPGGLGVLAYLAARRGDTETARALSEALHGDPGPLARRDLDVVALALPGADGALGTLGRAYTGALDLSTVAPRAVTESSARLRARGRDRLAAGDAQGALALAERALALDPADGEARLLAGKILLTLGGADPARHEFALVAAIAPELAALARRSAAEADAWRLATPSGPSDGAGGGK